MVWGYHEDDRPWHDDINDPVAEKYPVILGFYTTYFRTGTKCVSMATIWYYVIACYLLKVHWKGQLEGVMRICCAGFNEPNHSDQSDMEPEVAAEAWLELQALYPDRELVSGRSLKNSALRSIQWIAGEPRPRWREYSLVRSFLRGL